MTRFKQVIILVAIIIAGIAISMATEAKSGSVTSVSTSVPNKWNTRGCIFFIIKIGCLKRPAKRDVLVFSRS